MKRPRPPASSDGPALTEAERLRLAALLGSVSTHTLLNALTGLDRESDDARIIIAALLERLPGRDDDGPDQAPTMPM